MAAGHVVAFGIAAAVSIATAIAGSLLCGSQFTRSRRLLQRGSHVTARVVEAIPQHPAGQSASRRDRQCAVRCHREGSWRCG